MSRSQADPPEAASGGTPGSDQPTDDAILKRLKRIEAQVTDHAADDIEDRSPEWVWERYAAHYLQDGKSPNGLQSVRSAWNQFTEWMYKEGHEHLTDLSPRFPGRHDDWIVDHREYDKNRLSRGMHLTRIKQVVQYARTRGWIHPTIVPDAEEWDEVKPDIDKDDRVRSDPLPPERGERIMEWLERDHFGERDHCLWILVWQYALRVSAIRALDLDDLIQTERADWPDRHEFPGSHLRLTDRPERGLPLKNTREELAGRRVPLRPDAAEALDCYIDEHRIDHGRGPEEGSPGLLTTEHNPRIADSTVRSEVHRLTSPSVYGVRCECAGCLAHQAENSRRPYPSQIGRICDESRSPHQARHGAITRLLDDHDPTVLARVCGTSADTLRDHYDRADQYRRLGRLAATW